jgi:hypothetical protein
VEIAAEVSCTGRTCPNWSAKSKNREIQKKEKHYRMKENHEDTEGSSDGVA